MLLYLRGRDDAIRWAVLLIMDVYVLSSGHDMAVHILRVYAHVKRK